MATIATPAYFTPDDLLRMPDSDRFELVDGVLMEKEAMGAKAGVVVVKLSKALEVYAESKSAGFVMSADCGYRCFPHKPNMVRKPDVSFVRKDRIPGEIPEGFLEIAPDLVAEIASPNDLLYESEKKIADYLQAGVRLIWAVHPQTQTVQVYRPDGSSRRLGENDELGGEDVLPGFRVRVGDLFPPKPAVASSA